jgi:hypothetical protein
MAWAADLVGVGQVQVIHHAAGLLGGLAPGRFDDRLAELHFAAGQQPEPRIRASLLADERHRPGYPGHHHQRRRYYPAVLRDPCPPPGNGPVACPHAVS